MGLLKRVSGMMTIVAMSVFAQDAAAELALVESGVARAPIMIFEDAPPFTRQAADRLAEYIEKTSGARPELIEGQPDPRPKHAIWVGYQPVLDEIFPDLDFNFQHPEEILIAVNENHLVIAGRDVWDPEHLSVQLGRKTINGAQQEYGTANAVYTFIQEYLGVRWLWPGELGEDVLEQETIAFAPFEYRYHPQIRSRSGIFDYSRLGKGGGDSLKWTQVQRLSLDSLEQPGSHGFNEWWDRFHETHPEYFALQPDGTRSGFPGPGRHKMCKSNPGVWDQWLKTNVEEELEKNPTRRVFCAAANDSWASGYCICDRCRAWDHPEGELRVFRWAGLAQDYVAMSDRQVTFANTLGRKLKQRYPEKDYYVNILAYGHSRPAPVEAVPDDNVIVLCVGNFVTNPDAVDTAGERRSTHKEQFAAWAKWAPNVFWRPNITRRMTSMPSIPLTETIGNLRFVAENNCIGIRIDKLWEHWATRGPMYYIMAQMAWNPWRDGTAMLDDYFKRGYGRAAEDIRAYWRYMEQKWEESLDGLPDAPELFDDEFFDKANGFLDSAAESAEGQPEKYRKRVEFVRKGLDYTRMATEARKMMLRFEKSGGTDKQAEARAREIWTDEIMPLATDEEYPYAIRWQFTRPGHGHKMTGYYPEDLHRKW